MSASIRRVDAMKDANVHVATFCIAKKYVIFDGGLKLPIRWVGPDGHLTDDPDEAVAYEFGNEELGFGTTPFDIMDYMLLGEMEH